MNPEEGFNSLKDNIAALNYLLEKDKARQRKAKQSTEDRMAEQTGNLTFGIIKPDAVRDRKAGSILQRIIDGGFRVRAMKLVHMTLAEAEGFYAGHPERPFFGELTGFMW